MKCHPRRDFKPVDVECHESVQCGGIVAGREGSRMTVSDRELVLTDEFERALALLAGGRHLFLTGKAGTGKSTLIRRFISETDRNVVVVAPTGIAALNVDGYTIHRLFSFSTTTSLDDVRIRVRRE